MFVKLLFFMKIFSAYGFLVQMIFLSVLDMGPFISFFTLWLCFFAIENKILKLEINQEEYSGLGDFV